MKGEGAIDKLIITVTVDSTMSYPGNANMPPIEDVDTMADFERLAPRGGSRTRSLLAVRT